MIHLYKMFGHCIVLDVNSGAVHVVDPLVYFLLEHLSADLPQQCPQELIEGAAKETGYTPDDVQEAYNGILQLHAQGTLFSSDDYGVFAEQMVLSPVKAMCLNVSHDCNLRCDYCFAGKGDYDGARMVMSEETGKKAIDFLLEHSEDREFLELDFFGGEPLMNFEVVKKVVEYARSKEKEFGKTFRFTITTNGLLLDAAKAEYINREMSNVVLSVDGRKAVHDRVRTRVDGSGCYETVVKNFQNLVAGRGDQEYYVRGTFTKYNPDFSDDIFALNDLGFDQISIEPVVAKPSEPYALTMEDLPVILGEYETLAKRIIDSRKEGKRFNFFHYMIDLDQGPCAIKRLRGCGCGNEYVAVTPDGDLYPCHQFIGHEDWKMGNLYDSSFDREMKTRFSQCSIYQKPDCMECWAKFYCSGGCSANNMQYQGDILKAHTLTCEMERKRVECAIALLVEEQEGQDAAQ